MASVDLLALPAPPSTAIKWKKVIWFVKEVVVQSAEFLAYQYGMQMRPLPGPGSTESFDEWRRFVCTYDNTQSVVNADMAVFTVDIINYTNGAIDNTWTADDHLQCAAALNVFATTIKTMVPTRYALTSIKAYRMAFTPMPTPEEVSAPGFKDDPFADAGAPVYVAAQAIVGTGADTQADQVCSSITEETPVRRHWGRFYSPPLQGPNSGTGRWGTAQVDLMATAWNTALTTLQTHDMYTVVPSTRVQKYPSRVLSNVTGIHVDDVPDVIRRRRPKYVGYRKRFDEATP